MTIYILDKDLEKSAEYLDDKSLDKHIKEIAHILCDVHWYANNTCPPLAPRNFNLFKNGWVKWAACRLDHYKWLLQYAVRLCDEYLYRFSDHNQKTPYTLSMINKYNKLEDVIMWLHKNKPILTLLTSLSDSEEYDDNDLFSFRSGYLPLILPKKYQALYEKYSIYHPDKNIRDNAGYLTHQAHYTAKIEKGLLSPNPVQYRWTRREPPEFLTIYHDKIVLPD